MITDTLSNLPLYKMLGPNFERAIEYILNTRFIEMEPGKYEVDGENIFAIVNEFTTKPISECEPERHRKYADIQLIVSGTERFGYMPLINQKATTDFLPDNDVAFYNNDVSTLNYITLSADQFIIFLPDDIHQPEVFVDKPSKVKKVVMKVGYR